VSVRRRWVTTISIGLAAVVLVAGAAVAAPADPLPFKLATRPMSAADSAKLPVPVIANLNANPLKRTYGFYYGVWAPVHGVFQTGYGYSNAAAKRPAGPGQSFRIGSITKTFTATAVLLLAERGKVDLDRPVAAYVDGLGKLPGGSVATVRQLLNMTSGFPDYTNSGAGPFATLILHPHRVFTPQELIDFAATLPATPRGKFAYSSTNYIILGELIENVSHTSFGQFVKRNILVPLKLDHTIIPDQEVTAPVSSHGYLNARWNEFDPQPSQAVKDAVKPGMDVSDWSSSVGGAAGNGVSTMRDLARWAASDFGDSLLSPAMRAQRLTMVDASSVLPSSTYGLGIEGIAGTTWHFHGGEIFGWESELVANPATRQVAVASANACCGLGLAVLSQTFATYPGAADSCFFCTMKLRERR
jgi:D-alanyl-D-alanine carboxypeptidase